jgi:hypothetical protein
VLLAWHIQNGKYGDVALDKLNAALAAYSPGHMMKVKWDVALYLDEKANKEQRDALGTILGGQAGGEPAALAPFIGRIMGVKPVRIEFEAKGKERSLRIPQIAEVEIAAIEGHGGKLVTLENSPFSAVANQTTVVAKSKKLTLHDHGWNWNISEKNGYYSPFEFKGP